MGVDLYHHQEETMLYTVGNNGIHISNEVSQYLDETFEHAIRPYSGKGRYAECKIKNVISYHNLPLVCLIHKKM